MMACIDSMVATSQAGKGGASEGMETLGYQ